jgi:hypothetical protein
MRKEVEKAKLEIIEGEQNVHVSARVVPFHVSCFEKH